MSSITNSYFVLYKYKKHLSVPMPVLKITGSGVGSTWTFFAHLFCDTFLTIPERFAGRTLTARYTNKWTDWVRNLTAWGAQRSTGGKHLPSCRMITLKRNNRIRVNYIFSWTLHQFPNCNNESKNKCLVTVNQILKMGQENLTG